MKNKILLLIVVVLSVIAISGSKKETTYFNNAKKEEVKEEIKLALKDTSTGEIKNIELEDYIVGVVAGEMPASFNEEALKAQAIAARTYAMYKMKNSNQIILISLIFLIVGCSTFKKKILKETLVSKK